MQQVSIASLIIALGLLVDDPVVANDAIKRDLARAIRRSSRRGWVPRSWRGRSCSRRSPTSSRICRCCCLRATREVPLQPAGRADLRPGRLADRLDDLHSAARATTCCVPASKRVPMRGAAQPGFAGWYYRVGRAPSSTAGWSSACSSAAGRSAASCWRPARRNSSRRTFSTCRLSMSGCPRTRLWRDQRRRRERRVHHPRAADEYGADTPGQDGKPRRCCAR